MTKKLTVLFLLVFITVLNADWVNIDGNTNQKLFDHSSAGKEYTEINFTLDGYNIETINEKGVNYQKISYLDEGNFLETGKPDLPKFTRLIVIPDEGSVSFEVISKTEKVIQNMQIYPAQNLQKESEKGSLKFVIDEDFYTNGAVYPVNIVEVGEPVIMRDLRLVSVSVNPFQYDPQTNELRIITNLDVSVNASGRGGVNPIVTDKKVSRFFEPIYQSTILNYETTIERDAVYQDPSYLFIYPDDSTLLTNLEYLTDWKRQKGFEVTLASTADTGITTTSIKAYIQNAYDNWSNPPEFVCIVGDANGSYTIPTYTETWSGYSGEGDHPYSQLEGGDILADVILGRISISSIADLQTYVAKVLTYEKEPFMLDTAWYNKSLMVGDPAHGSGPSTIFTNQSIIEMMQQHAPDIVATEIYTEPFSSGISSSLNSGVCYFNYRGWLGMSGFYNSDIDALSNFKMLPFAVILTCDTGSFEGTARSEAFIRAGSAGNPIGAIASVGTATSGTHTNFNNSVDAGIYHGIFADGIYNPGGALNRGKLALYEHYPLNPWDRVAITSHWNTLMGDPGVELWTGIPQTMVATYDASPSPGTNYLEVNVTNNLSIPLEGAWVTAYDETLNMFATGYTDENGDVALEINAEALGSASLTVTNHNYIPHLGEFTIVSSDRFVNVVDVLIDDTIGNNDGFINPGEDIGLEVSLKNFGSMSASSVTATITTENDFITITDGTESYGTISAGSTVFSSDDFDISVDADILGGTEIKLDVVITDGLANTWNDIIFLTVEGANLDVVEYSVDDANEYLDPGETTLLDITLQNNGLVTANAVSGILSSTDSRVTVSDANGYFGNVSGAGGQASTTLDNFEVTASSQLVVGTQILMELQLTNADGYDSIVQFLLGIGEVNVTDPVGPDAYGYFCYDDGDTGYVSAPTYDWIEINGIGTNLDLDDPGDTGDIETITSLPITLRMYGEEYDSITICSNGWIAPGGSSQASFMNSQIPGPQGPSPMIAPFWDDLRMGSGDVYWYYDSLLQAIIVEWDNVQNEEDYDEETFQVILYDSNLYPTSSGDSQIKFQYKVINNTSAGSYTNHGQYCSIGLEDPTGTIGLEYTFNNSYPDAAKTLQNEMAILFTTAPVPLGAPFLALGDIIITDTNGNSQIDYNEDIDLDIPLNNLGDVTATGISAVLLTLDTYITITQNSSNYNNITDGSSGVNLTDYEFTVAEDCPDGHLVYFYLNVTSNEDSWSLNFTQEVNAPEVEFSSVYVDDGDNHVLDPGETCNIEVTFTNNGGSDAFNADVLISESDTYLTLNSTTHDFGTFLSGQSETAIFNVTVSPSAPEGHSADINWNISADHNYSTGSVLVLPIGYVTEGFETGDFSAFSWVFDGDADWSIVQDAVYEGLYSAKSGMINDNQTSELLLNIDVSDGWIISFYKKVSSESPTYYYDGLVFYIDNVEYDRWHGEDDWSEETYLLTAGNHTFKWVYEKDGGTTNGDDCAWIDFITIRPREVLAAPYLESFENGGAIPEQWASYSTSGEFWRYNNTNGGHSASTDHTTGTGYFAWVDDSESPSSNDVTLHSPQVDISSLTVPELSFWLYSDNEGYSDATISLDIYDGATWQVGVWSHTPNTAGWEEFVIDLSTYAGPVEAKFIVDEFNSDYYDDISLDDVYFREQPTCPNPSALTVTNETMTGADLGWTSVDSFFDIYIDVAGAVAPLPATTPTVDNNAGTSYTWAAGMAATAYDWWVRTDCDVAGVSDWVQGPAFVTLCDLITTFPYNESFENTLFAPLCWDNVQIVGSGTQLWDRQTSGSSPTCTPIDGAAMARFNCYSYSTGVSAMLVSRGITFPDDQYRVRFNMYRDTGYASNAELVNVYYNTTPDLAGTPTLLGTVHRSTTLAPVVAAAGWYEYVFDVPAASSGNAYIMLEGVSAYGNNIFIDNVTVEAISAVPVFNITPDTMDFGTVFVNNSTGNQTFTISNVGVGTINVSSVSLTGADAAEFTLVDTNLAYYPVAITTNSMVVDVAFLPTSAGVKNAFLTVVDDLARSSHNIPLTGEGTIPPLGDVISNPFVVGALPYNVTGSTVGFADNYGNYGAAAGLTNLLCTNLSYFSTSTLGAGGDVVYEITLATPTQLIIDLCASDYDTAVALVSGDGVDPEDVLLIDDDSYLTSADGGCAVCCQSYINCSVPVPAGTYYIIVGGYGTNEGDYDLTVSAVTAPTAPTNVAIVNDGTNVTITWDPVVGAASYVVYSSTSPTGTFVVDATGVLTGEQWVAPTPAVNTFYQVTSTSGGSTDAIEITNNEDHSVKGIHVEKVRK